MTLVDLDIQFDAEFTLTSDKFTIVQQHSVLRGGGVFARIPSLFFTIRKIKCEVFVLIAESLAGENLQGHCRAVV